MHKVRKMRVPPEPNVCVPNYSRIHLHNAPCIYALVSILSFNRV